MMVYEEICPLTASCAAAGAVLPHCRAIYAEIGQGNAFRPRLRARDKTNLL